MARCSQNPTSYIHLETPPAARLRCALRALSVCQTCWQTAQGIPPWYTCAESLLPRPRARAAPRAQRPQLTTRCARTPRPQCTGSWPTCARQVLQIVGPQFLPELFKLCRACCVHMTQRACGPALADMALAELALGRQPCTAHTSMQADVILLCIMHISSCHMQE